MSPFKNNKGCEKNENLFFWLHPHHLLPTLPGTQCLHLELWTVWQVLGVGNPTEPTGPGWGPCWDGLFSRSHRLFGHRDQVLLFTPSGGCENKPFWMDPDRVAVCRDIALPCTWSLPPVCVSQCGGVAERQLRRAPKIFQATAENLRGRPNNSQAVAFHLLQ